MEWPHDPDDESGSEGMRKYDMAVIAKKIDETEDFPLERTDFLERYGDHPIRINHERVVALEDIFEHVDGTTFETMIEFHQAVGDGMRAGGFWDYQPSQR